MNNIDSYLKLGFEFYKKYCVEYFRALLLPFACALIGIFFVILTTQNPAFAFLAIVVSIPSICFAFWKGYIATYAMNFIAYDFFKKNEVMDFKIYVENVNKKQLAKYLSFCAILTIICYLPSFIYISKFINLGSIFSNPLALIADPIALFSVCGILLLNTLILIPFLNFYNQALYFRKENESYLNLFLNCYKYLNKDGFILSLIFLLIGTLISLLDPFIYAILALLLNIITFSVNTFWYSERCQKEI